MERERHRRILLSVWAYAYEFLHESLVSDGDFDAQCRRVDLSVDTGNPEMDAWFRENFDPSTGMWVHNHPNKRRLEQIAKNLIGERRSGKRVQVRPRRANASSAMLI